MDSRGVSCVKVIEGGGQFSFIVYQKVSCCSCVGLTPSLCTSALACELEVLCVAHLELADQLCLAA